MVQTASQYVFLHHCILQYLQTYEKNIMVSKLHEHVKKLDESITTKTHMCANETDLQWITPTGDWDAKDYPRIAELLRFSLQSH